MPTLYKAIRDELSDCSGQMFWDKGVITAVLLKSVVKCVIIRMDIVI